MTSRPFAAFLLLASAGVACLVYAGADFIAHEWAVQNLWPLLAAGFAVVPIVAFVAWGRRWWEREGAKINHDRALTWALDTETARKEAELNKPPVTIAPVPAPEAWKTPLERWFTAGDRLGFGVRSLAPNIVSGPDWGKLTAFYCSEAGWGVLQCRGGQAVTEWGEGWTLTAVLAEIERGALPCPPGPPLEVHVLVLDTTQTEQKHAKRSKRGAGALTVDGTAREVGQ